MTKQAIEVGFYTGRILLYLADKYGTIEQVVGELVQNFLDAGATHAQIWVDLTNRTLVAYDNGKGASIAEMQRRIGNIGAPLKKKGIGGKGIGNLAPLALCSPESEWSLTTHPRGQRYFRVFLKFKNVDQKDVKFQWEPMDNGYQLRRDKKVLDAMATCVELTEIQPSALIALGRQENPASHLATVIAETYSSALLKTKANIMVYVAKEKACFTSAVKPQSFPGTKEEVTMLSSGKHPITFEIYRTEIPTKKARLYIEHGDEYRISLPLRNIKEIWDPIKSVWGSGYFQGIIRLGNFCELTPTRNKLKYTSDLDELFEVIVEFHSRYMEKWLNDIRGRAESFRTNKLVGDVLDKFLPLFQANPNLLPECLRAALGPGGHPPNDGVVRPKNPKAPYITSEKPIDDEDEETEKPDKEEKKDPVKDLSKHTRVAPSKIVRHSSGLTVIPQAADPTSKHGCNWRVRVGDEGVEKGFIVVNTSHADWKTAMIKGDAAADTYLTLLISLVCALPNAASKSRADVFKQEFEENFLRYTGPLIPKIPQRAGKKGLVEITEDE